MHHISYQSASKKESILKVCEEFSRNNTDRGENPSGDYHGNMHIREDVPIQDDFDAACEKINQIATDKWYYDVAVRYYDTSKVKKSKKIEGLEERIKVLRQKKIEYNDKHSVKLQQANLIGCKECGSKIAKKYLRSERCPVCNNDLRSKTVLDRLEKFDTDIKLLEKQITEEKRKKKTSCPVKWAFKIEVHG